MYFKLRDDTFLLFYYRLYTGHTIRCPTPETTKSINRTHPYGLNTAVRDTLNNNLTGINQLLIEKFKCSTFYHANDFPDNKKNLLRTLPVFVKRLIVRLAEW